MDNLMVYVILFALFFLVRCWYKNRCNVGTEENIMPEPQTLSNAEKAAREMAYWESIVEKAESPEERGVAFKALRKSQLRLLQVASGEEEDCESSGDSKIFLGIGDEAVVDRRVLH